ncbi:ATP-grasp domain-containing protein [Candidatus Tachikawaea gelatinosa]|uniref:Phosphoribosylaminoimidazole carboxylase ATPase subunit n=1 Tax=Candidatus Tachikawaea gelatinosa TaxID=1410383 RepID=A0A090AS90_9ENTR|nr:ATP-grasp domain-containing protein [Candidatus Tachikawaea gelatinosa]BAP58740.1 phosphoribosylaminoimidazole carboxylase ATPase subunit [Candidatus Tachikawaea gelatinosa]
MKLIYVLGNGQLGQMLKQAGEPLGIKVMFINKNTKSLIKFFDAITIETENWPKNIITQTLIKNPLFFNYNAIICLTDRLTQKKFLDQLKMPNVKWIYLSKKKTLKDAFQKLGKRLILKKRTGGYNGLYQKFIEKENVENNKQDYQQYIFEKKVDFIEEISLIGARSKNNHIVSYPITYNFHENSMLRASISFKKTNKNIQNQSENILKTIMNQLKYVGVMVIEFFLIDFNTLLINEIAPRVHNSGHWTQNGASISQFELHLRAILDYPMYNPTICYDYSVMINLIGIDFNMLWINQSSVHLHWYSKKTFKGRKVGHLNIVDNNYLRLCKTLKNLQKNLPNNYASSIEWLIKKIILHNKF